MRNEERLLAGAASRQGPALERERLERDVEVFGRSVLEMIRQKPGIQEAELRGMYTRRERAFVDEAISRLKAGYGIAWREDGGSTRLYPWSSRQRPSL